MVQGRQLDSEVGHDIAQAVARSEMSCGKRHELRPTRHLTQGSADVMLFSQRVEFVSRDQPKKLAEHCAMMSQGLVPRCGTMVSRNSIVPLDERTKPPLLQVLWDSSDSDPDFRTTDIFICAGVAALFAVA